jgi:C-terminal processing protease CtpA/Prc
MFRRPICQWGVLFLVVTANVVYGRASDDHLPKTVQNPGFEDGQPGEVPPGWFVPLPSTNAGYSAKIVEEKPHDGKRCAVLERSKESNAAGFGNLMQTVDAAQYRGKRIRYQAAVRTDGRAQLWLRVDRKGGETGFFDNMGERPIRDGAWRSYLIDGDVDTDAESINFGIMLIGEGKTWIDAVKLEVAGRAGEGIEPPRAFQGRELENLVAYTKLLGLVRYFHPSDQSATTDWDAFAIRGIPIAQAAETPAELAQRLEQLFQPIAPLVRVFPSDKRPTAAQDQASPSGTRKVLAWRHIGVGGKPGIYSSKRVGNSDNEFPNPARPFTSDLGGGVTAVVPLAVFADEQGTLPHVVPVKSTPMTATTAKDRNTRLAAVALAWNVFQHFYPYFDVVQTDWPAALRIALTKAATDRDERAFLDTLRGLVAALHDGHGNVMHSSDTGYSLPAFRWDWVEDQLVVVQIAEEMPLLKPGDVIVKVNGVPAAEALAEKEKLISGATAGWKRYRGLTELLRGPANSTMSLTVRDRDGKVSDVRARRTFAFDKLREPRPAKVAELKPGVVYINLDETSDADFTAALPQLASARGIIFDLRGYPRGSTAALAHLIDEPVTCAQWHVPVTYYPDRTHVSYQFSNWKVTPQTPRFKAKVAFLTDGRAISYAETYLGIVEHYKLAEIVGAPTAGTNGNVNPFTLPGGYQVVWTGMKVLKHDGSRHHGVGIRPTIPVSRTVRGVAEGKDEVLDRAIEVVSRADK